MNIPTERRASRPQPGLFFKKVSDLFEKNGEPLDHKAKGHYPYAGPYPRKIRPLIGHMDPAVTHSGIRTFFRTTCHIVIISNALSLAISFSAFSGAAASVIL